MAQRLRQQFVNLNRCKIAPLAERLVQDLREAGYLRTGRNGPARALSP
jgi:hypothetical protein